MGKLIELKVQRWETGVITKIYNSKKILLTKCEFLQ